MGTTLNHYPTTAEIRALTDAEDLARLVSEVSDYHRTTTLAEYHGDVTPDTFHAWGYFAEQIVSQYPDAEVGRDFKITRKLTQTELEEVALSSEQSKRYYHPENYPLDYAYDDDKGTYVLAADIKNDKE